MKSEVMEKFVHAEDAMEHSSLLLTSSLFHVLGLSRARYSLLGVLEVSGMRVPFAVCRNRSRSPSPPAAYGNVAAVIPNTWRSDWSSFPRSGGCGLPAHGSGAVQGGQRGGEVAAALRGRGEEVGQEIMTSRRKLVRQLKNTKNE